MGNVRITGVQRSASGPLRVEVEVQRGAGRVCFAQSGGPVPHSQLGALVVDGAPVALSLESATVAGALVLPASFEAALPATPSAAPSLDEARVLALAPLLVVFGDGLYTVSISRGGAMPAAALGFTPGSAGYVDVACASDDGAALFASLGRGALVLLAGRTAAKRGAPAFLVSADVILDAPGFEVRHHDRGAREAFSRSPNGVLDDAALRDGVAALRASHPDVDVGPFTEDRVEPAAQQARALAWDLRAEDGIEDVSDSRREKNGVATEFRASVRVKSVTFEIAFISRDGRHVEEAVVRSGVRFRATGLRPAARALARILRQLADEGG